MKKFYSKTKGFTLIELLVVIVIIGILATLATVGLNSVRAKARNTKRLADIRQMQTSLEMYFNDENKYPTDIGQYSFAPGQPLLSSNGIKTYMSKVPNNPKPSDNACPSDFEYIYRQLNNGASYSLTYCLGDTTSNIVAGVNTAAPNALSTGDRNIPQAAFVCGNVLSYGGYNYGTVLIGSQCWMKENMQGGSGSCVSATNTWDITNCDASKTNLYGYHYYWTQALNIDDNCLYDTLGGSSCPNYDLSQIQGICPPGWHIPTVAEGQTLITGKNIRELREPKIPNNAWSTELSPAATNSSGLSARGSGADQSGTWLESGASANFWLAKDYFSSPNYYAYSIKIDGSTVYIAQFTPRDFGLSVRCLKN